MSNQQQETTSLEAIALFGIEVTKEAGALAMNWLTQRSRLKIENKGHQDWVSQADREVENLIRNKIAMHYPSHQLLGEESGGDRTPPCWVIDPIDGTTNYLYGMADFVVSLAFVDEQGPAIGILYAPAHQRLFYAIRGNEAVELIQGQAKPLIPRKCQQNELVVGLNLNYQPGIAEQYLVHSQQLINHGHQIRACGAAAWSLLQVATGELDGCFLGNANIWDVLAAQIICKQSGLMTSPWFANSLNGSAWACPEGSPLPQLLNIK
ncbi:MAG: inositol monophosphatase family protein [Vibrio sp.]